MQQAAQAGQPSGQASSASEVLKGEAEQLPSPEPAPRRPAEERGQQYLINSYYQNSKVLKIVDLLMEHYKEL